jgi:hypothetical protein
MEEKMGLGEGLAIDKLHPAGVSAALLFTKKDRRFDYTDDDINIDSSWPTYPREMYGDGEPETFAVIINIYMHRVRARLDARKR